MSSAQMLLQPGLDAPEDRQLADDIARAMHHRPLMSRLARVDAVHGDAAGAVALSAARLAPAAEDMPPPIPADQRSLEEVIDDLGQVAGPPPSAEWLDRARLEHRSERRRHAVGWLTTLAIVTAIVGVAFLFLRA